MDKQEQIKKVIKELLEGVKELNGEYQEGWENVIENAEKLINKLNQPNLFGTPLEEFIWDLSDRLERIEKQLNS